MIRMIQRLLSVLALGATLTACTDGRDGPLTSERAEPVAVQSRSVSPARLMIINSLRSVLADSAQFALTLAHHGDDVSQAFGQVRRQLAGLTAVSGRGASLSTSCATTEEEACDDPFIKAELSAMNPSAITAYSQTRYYMTISHNLIPFLKN